MHAIPRFLALLFWVTTLVSPIVVGQQASSGALVTDGEGDATVGGAVPAPGPLSGPIDITSLSVTSDRLEALTFELHVVDTRPIFAAAQPEESYTYSVAFRSDQGIVVNMTAYAGPSLTQHLAPANWERLQHTLCSNSSCNPDSGAVWIDGSNPRLRFSIPYEVIRGQTEPSRISDFELYASRMIPTGEFEDRASSVTSLSLLHGRQPLIDVRVVGALAGGVRTVVDWDGRQQVIRPAGAQAVEFEIFNRGPPTTIQLGELGGTGQWTIPMEGNEAVKIPVLFQSNAQGITATSQDSSRELNIAFVDGGAFANGRQTYYLHAADAGAPPCPEACGPFARRWLSPLADDPTANLDAQGNSGGSLGISAPGIPAWSSTFIQDAGVPLAGALSAAAVNIPLSARVPLTGQLTAQLELWSPLAECDGAPCFNITSIAKGSSDVSLSETEGLATVSLTAVPDARLSPGSTITLSLSLESNDPALALNSVAGIRSFGGELMLEVNPDPGPSLSLIRPVEGEFIRDVNPGEVAQFDLRVVNLRSSTVQVDLASLNERVTFSADAIRIEPLGTYNLALFVRAPSTLGEHASAIQFSVGSEPTEVTLLLNVVESPDLPSATLPGEESFPIPLPGRDSPNLGVGGLLVVLLIGAGFRLRFGASRK